MIRHVLYPAVCAVARRLGRSRRIEQALAAIRTQLTRMESKMSDADSKLLAEAKEIHAAVVATMKSRAADIDAAIVKAKAAWDADSAADHAAALAEMEAIKAELANPPAFSPSGN